MTLSHIDESGAARMVDVSAKPAVRRTARAAAHIALQPGTIAAIREATVEKGDVLATARIAGICAAKQTSHIIPLCHTIAIDSVEIEFSVSDTGIDIASRAVCTDRTGIEMEALTAASVAALTIYDMCKAIDNRMCITNVHLVEKAKESV